MSHVYWTIIGSFESDDVKLSKGTFTIPTPLFSYVKIERRTGYVYPFKIVMLFINLVHVRVPRCLAIKGGHSEW